VFQLQLASCYLQHTALQILNSTLVSKLQVLHVGKLQVITQALSFATLLLTWNIVQVLIHKLLPDENRYHDVLDLRRGNSFQQLPQQILQLPIGIRVPGESVQFGGTDP
jgi:hypothetical protein